MSSGPTAFSGCWRIDWMSAWDKKTIDLAGPAFILFDRSGGEFRFICVTGYMQCSFSQGRGAARVEFTWDGSDEMDEARGRGSATLKKDGSIKGRVCIHDGDDSEFTARRSDFDFSKSETPAPTRRRRQ